MLTLSVGFCFCKIYSGTLIILYLDKSSPPFSKYRLCPLPVPSGTPGAPELRCSYSTFWILFPSVSFCTVSTAAVRPWSSSHADTPISTGSVWTCPLVEVTVREPQITSAPFRPFTASFWFLCALMELYIFRIYSLVFLGRLVCAPGVGGTGPSGVWVWKVYTAVLQTHLSSGGACRQVDKHGACLPWAPGWHMVCLPLIHGQDAEVNSAFDLSPTY